MKAAATIHTAEGLYCRVKERFPGKTDVPPRQVPKLDGEDAAPSAAPSAEPGVESWYDSGVRL